MPRLLPPLTRIALLCCVGLVVSGCATMTLQRALEQSSRGAIPRSMASEAGGNWEQALGHVDKYAGTSILSVARDRPTRISGYIEADMDWWHGEEMAVLTLTGQFCVAYNRPVDTRVGELSVSPERAEQVVEFLAGHEDFWLETFDSLTDIPPRPLVIKERAIQLRPVRALQGSAAKTSQGYRFNRKGQYETKTNISSFETWMFVLCGAAPELTEKTRFVTVSGSNGKVFAWELSDDASASVPGPRWVVRRAVR